jgi:hypothetical protein
LFPGFAASRKRATPSPLVRRSSGTPTTRNGDHEYGAFHSQEHGPATCKSGSPENTTKSRYREHVRTRSSGRDAIFGLRKRSGIGVVPAHAGKDC